jgi:hypothetical protein
MPRKYNAKKQLKYVTDSLKYNGEHRDTSVLRYEVYQIFCQIKDEKEANTFMRIAMQFAYDGIMLTDSEFEELPESTKTGYIGVIGLIAYYRINWFQKNKNDEAKKKIKKESGDSSEVKDKFANYSTYIQPEVYMPLRAKLHNVVKDIIDIKSPDMKSVVCIMYDIFKNEIPDCGEVSEDNIRKMKSYLLSSLDTAQKSLRILEQGGYIDKYSISWLTKINLKIDMGIEDSETDIYRKELKKANDFIERI